MAKSDLTTLRPLSGSPIAAMTRPVLLLDPESGERLQTLAEEVVNSLSHAIALAAALVGAPFLLRQAGHAGEFARWLGALVFAASVILLYASSTLYHAIPRGSAKRALRRVEHMAIFILIAGTYTPFALGPLAASGGRTLLGLIWGLALVGVGFKAFKGTGFPVASTVLYVAMGWIGLAIAAPLGLRLPSSGARWILMGGVAYTSGIFFFALAHRRKFSHLVWHLFVVAGTSFHALAVYWYG